MFALNIDALIEAINAKQKEHLSIRALLSAMVPNPMFGYPEDSAGEFETESDYNNLLWLDERQKPTWAELQAIRQTVFDQELAQDLEQLRQLRYLESPIEYGGLSFNVSPTMIGLVDSQSEYAKITQSADIAVPTANKQICRIPTTDIDGLLLAMRTKLNQWIIDPRIP